MFFRSLPRFSRFLTLLGGFGGALWRGFCTNIDCSLENTTPWFYPGVSTVLTVAAGPGSIKGEKHACGSNASFRKQKKQLRKLFLTILGSRGEPDFGLFLIKCCFFLNLFFFNFRLSLGRESASEAGSL